MGMEKIHLKSSLSEEEYKDISDPKLYHKTPISSVSERDYFFQD